MTKWLTLLYVLPLALSTPAYTSAQSVPEASCPFEALLTENVQRYEKAYADEVLKRLPTSSLTDERAITPRELVKPMYDFMRSNGWPVAITTALSTFMAGPDSNFAACFPKLSKVQAAFRQRPQQRRMATEQSREAAEQGSASAQKMLGDNYRNGRGVPRDYQLVHRFHGTDHLCGIRVRFHSLYPDF
jgi:hypothetical protein